MPTEPRTEALWEALRMDIEDVMVRGEWGQSGDNPTDIIARHRLAIEAEVLEDVAERVRAIVRDIDFLVAEAHTQEERATAMAVRDAVLALIPTDRETT